MCSLKVSILGRHLLSVILPSQTRSTRAVQQCSLLYSSWWNCQCFQQAKPKLAKTFSVIAFPLNSQGLGRCGTLNILTLRAASSEEGTDREGEVRFTDWELDDSSVRELLLPPLLGLGCRCGGREGPCMTPGLPSSSELSPPKLVMNVAAGAGEGDRDLDEDRLKPKQAMTLCIYVQFIGFPNFFFLQK